MKLFLFTLCSTFFLPETKKHCQQEDEVQIKKQRKWWWPHGHFVTRSDTRPFHLSIKWCSKELHTLFFLFFLRISSRWWTDVTAVFPAAFSVQHLHPTSDSERRWYKIFIYLTIKVLSSPEVNGHFYKCSTDQDWRGTEELQRGPSCRMMCQSSGKSWSLKGGIHYFMAWIMKVGIEKKKHCSCLNDIIFTLQGWWEGWNKSSVVKITLNQFLCLPVYLMKNKMKGVSKAVLICWMKPMMQWWANNWINTFWLGHLNTHLASSVCVRQRHTATVRGWPQGLCLLPLAKCNKSGVFFLFDLVFFFFFVCNLCKSLLHRVHWAELSEPPCPFFPLSERSTTIFQRLHGCLNKEQRLHL